MTKGTTHALPFPRGLREKIPLKVNLGFAEGKFACCNLIAVLTGDSVTRWNRAGGSAWKATSR